MRFARDALSSSSFWRRSCSISSMTHGGIGMCTSSAPDGDSARSELRLRARNHKSAAFRRSVGDKATQAQKTSRSSGGLGAAKRRSGLQGGSASRGVGWHVRCSTLDVKRGFTLIELMIVVAIIGTIASIAVPNYLRFQCKSKQVEAKTNLGAIRICEEAAVSETGSYLNLAVIGPSTSPPNELGFAVKGSRRRYSFEVRSATTTDYLAVASAAAGEVGIGDEWTSDAGPVLRNTVQGCN
jgi:prepilin-type N-terminal cleavage/methylation domain-containing protein